MGPPRHDGLVADGELVEEADFALRLARIKHVAADAAGFSIEEGEGAQVVAVDAGQIIAFGILLRAELAGEDGFEAMRVAKGCVIVGVEARVVRDVAAAADC